MTKLRLTGWYSGEQKPVRKGVYERDYTIGNSFSYFDGLDWMFFCESVELASKERNRSFTQNHPWRGIKK